MFYSQKLSLFLALASTVVANPPPYIPGFKLTWKDEFIGSARHLPSSKQWIIDTGTSYPGGPSNWGTGEIQVYTDSTENVRLTGNGQLMIKPIRDAYGTWTSARIETKRKDFMARPGGQMKIQARIQIPDATGVEGVGYWSAFWTLGAAYRGNYWNWPSVSEIDIMENVNGLDRIWGVFHCDKNPGGACNEPNGIGASRPCPGSACAGNFHTYSVVVDRSISPEEMRWYVDGILHHTVNETTVGTDVWAQGIHQGHFILLNVAMGGGFPNGVYGSPTPLNTTVSGRPMMVDYVAVYNC